MCLVCIAVSVTKSFQLLLYMNIRISLLVTKFPLFTQKASPNLQQQQYFGARHCTWETTKSIQSTLNIKPHALCCQRLASKGRQCGD